MPRDCYIFFVGEKELENYIKTVIRECRFIPDVIDTLYLDSIDYHGIIWYYEDIDESIKEINSKNKK